MPYCPEHEWWLVFWCFLNAIVPHLLGTRAKKHCCQWRKPHHFQIPKPRKITCANLPQPFPHKPRTATDALEASDGLLLEATSPAVRIEARFADGRLMISFTDLENLPAFAAQVRALKASYCADMTRDFIPVVEPMSRRLRFQRTLPLETGAEVPAPQILGASPYGFVGGLVCHRPGTGQGTGRPTKPQAHRKPQKNRSCAYESDSMG